MPLPYKILISLVLGCTFMFLEVFGLIDEKKMFFQGLMDVWLLFKRKFVFGVNLCLTRYFINRLEVQHCQLQHVLEEMLDLVIHAQLIPDASFFMRCSWLRNPFNFSGVVDGSVTAESLISRVPHIPIRQKGSLFKSQNIL